MGQCIFGNLEGLTIGERIRVVRKRKGISMQELADAVGISVATLSNYENNKTNPNISLVTDICMVLGVTMNMIVRGREPKKQRKPLIKEAKE